MRRLSLAWGIAGVALLAAASARADAIGPPPTDCPAGTRGESSHAGPYCAAATCSTDADCGTGQACRDAALCIEQRACGGLRFDGGPYPDGGFPPPCTFDAVTALCEGGAACATGACATRRVCEPLPTAPSSSGGCACALGGGQAGEAGAWTLLAAVGVTLAWRRRRRA